MRQTLLTLFLVLGVFVFVMLLGGTLREISDLLVNRQLRLGLIGQVLLLLLPRMLAFALPMAMLSAALLVFGRLSADYELTAMRACGVALGTVAAPVILLSVLLASGCFYLRASVAPRCEHRLRTLPLEVMTTQPLTWLEAGRYIREIPGYVVYIGYKDGNTLQNLHITMLDNQQNVIATVRARRGVVTPKPDERKLLIDLHDVRGDLRDPADPTNVNKIRGGTTAERYPMEFDLGPLYQKVVSSRKLRELEFGELVQEIRALTAQGIHPAVALEEAHERIVSAVACVSFTLIGIPLGIRASRRETTIGMAISLGLAMGYYFVSMIATVLRDRPHLFPELILWAPNVLFQLLGLFLLWRASRA